MYYRKLERSSLARHKFKRIPYNTEIYRTTNKAHSHRECIYIYIACKFNERYEHIEKTLNTKYKFPKNVILDIFVII